MMKKIWREILMFFGLLSLAFMSISPAHAWVWESGYQSDVPNAENIDTDTTNFDGVLDSLDTTVQAALDTIDNSLSDVLVDFGGSSFADDQVFIADSVTGGTPRTINDCDDANEALTYDQATNSWGCNTIAGASGFTDGGADVALTTSTDNVGIGGSPLAKLSVTGDTDEAQFVVRFHSTQTSVPITFETSAGTDRFTFAADGTFSSLGSGTESATFGGGSQSTYAVAFNLSGSNDPTLTAIDGGWKWGATSEDISSVFSSNTLTQSSSTGVTNITYTSIGLTTGAASNFSAGTTTLGVLAGSIDAGGANSIEVVNGTGPTVDAAGEVAVDTTDDQYAYYGGAKRILTYKMTKSLTYESPTSSDLFYFWKPQDNVTITAIKCIVDPAGSGESAVIDIQECDANGDSCATVDAAITCANTSTADDGSFSNPTIDAADWVVLDGGTVTGTVTNVAVQIEYVVDAE